MVAWFAGASGEIVLPGPDGPGMLTQRRGLSQPYGEPGPGISSRRRSPCAPGMR
ncbi:hypothetical protein G7085_17480 [Tessaracoccus sp. HDW20]|uniref:hypothetical protein n=1 Tax=Tessaracoccus coleopterorum TaxID=2714950 RepID=UPI0018D2DD96|nr:hypothetical protein [Tessaracoccus coleopterorum]NHB85764.1 hypothetical protein [Tessaracoccus coleopterorum]